MNRFNTRYQSAMDAIHGDIASLGLPPIDRNMLLLSEIREGMGAEVTAEFSDLPRRVRAMREAIRRSFQMVQDVNCGLLGAKAAVKHLDGVLGQVLYVMQAGSRSER